MGVFTKKKYYKQVDCKACDGTGKMLPVCAWEATTATGPFEYEEMRFMIVGICLVCRGRGTQTVLDREE